MNLRIDNARRHAFKLGLLVGMLQLSGCITLLNPDPHEVAQSWVGYNVDVLLQRWGNPPTPVFQNGSEKDYYWTFGKNGGYVNTTHQAAQGQDGNGQMVMGEVAGGYYQPPVSFCELTFYANGSGTITRYVLNEHDHNQCTLYVASWGGPNKKTLF